VSAPRVQDPILWGALGCALIGTAHSEWSLAVSVGAHPWIASAVPGALDLYVLRALQVRRDVFLAVLAMVAANVAWYLVHSGDLPVGWQLRSAVAAVAPLVVWRVHSLKHSRNRSELREDAAGAVSAPADAVPSAVAYPVAEGCTHNGFCRDANGVQCIPCPEPAPASAPVWTPGYHLDGCDGVHAPGGPSECIRRAGELSAAGAPSECTPDYVPFDWTKSSGPHLKAVPDLPPAFDPVSAVHSFPDVVHLTADAPLEPGDEVHLPGGREYLDNCAKGDREPSARDLAKAIKVSQKKAGRILKHLQREDT